MNVIAAALRELIAAGVTGDALVTAIENIETKFIESIEAEAFAADKARKAAGAARQARYRKRHVTSLTSRNVTVTDVTSVTSPEHIDSSSSNTQSNKKRKKVSIPEFWLPNETGLALAKQEGWDDHKIKLEIHRFQDHAQQHNRQYADWQAAWRNWVTSPFQKNGGTNGHGRKQTLVEIGEELAREAREIERRAGIRREDDGFGSR